MQQMRLLSSLSVGQKELANVLQKLADAGIGREVGRRQRGKQCSGSGRIQYLGYDFPGVGVVASPMDSGFVLTSDVAQWLTAKKEFPHL